MIRCKLSIIIAKSLANTFVFVTHDQGEAMAMSDRIAVMHDIELFYKFMKFMKCLKHKFVANFVGHSNLFDGYVSNNIKKIIMSFNISLLNS